MSRGRLTGSASTDRGPGPGLLTVQLLPVFLADGELPRAAVGEELDVAPAVYAGRQFPWVAETEWWNVDEFGTFDGFGSVLRPSPDASPCGCRIDLLDAGGWLFPLNWATAEPTDGRVRLEGALYLEPELAAGTEHGEAIALCRRRHRLTAVRRYRRTEGPPVSPVPLPGIPAPQDVSDAAVYVADLEVLEGEGTPD